MLTFKKNRKISIKKKNRKIFIFVKFFEALDNYFWKKKYKIVKLLTKTTKNY